MTSVSIAKDTIQICKNIGWKKEKSVWKDATASATRTKPYELWHIKDATIATTATQHIIHITRYYDYYTIKRHCYCMLQPSNLRFIHSFLSFSFFSNFFPLSLQTHCFSMEKEKKKTKITTLKMNEHLHHGCFSSLWLSMQLPKVASPRTETEPYSPMSMYSSSLRFYYDYFVIFSVDHIIFNQHRSVYTQTVNNNPK